MTLAQRNRIADEADKAIADMHRTAARGQWRAHARHLVRLDRLIAMQDYPMVSA